MDTKVVEHPKSGIYKKDAKGNIMFCGSGKYFRDQKERYSVYPEPYNNSIKIRFLRLLRMHRTRYDLLSHHYEPHSYYLFSIYVVYKLNFRIKTDFCLIRTTYLLFQSL